MMGEGTVNDEELVEVIAGAECTCAPAWKDRGLVDDKCWRHRVADVLSEVRSAGFQVFRPEDCEAIDVVDDAGPGEASRWGPSAAAMDALEHSPPGTYNLVPSRFRGVGMSGKRIEDAEIIEAIALGLHDDYCDADEGECADDDRYDRFAASALAALRDGGLDVVAADALSDHTEGTP